MSSTEDRAAGDRRARLIHAAGELFGERSFDEVTTTEIARRAGVSYGLLAHHFGSKRGIYLAALRDAAQRIGAMQDQLTGDASIEGLRVALRQHITAIDDNRDLFLTVLRAAHGSDPEVRAIIDDMRWGGAQRILRELGAREPAPPILRTTMRAWVSYLDELILDQLHHDHDVPVEYVVELAVAALAAGLRTALTLNPDTGLDPDTLTATASH